MTRRKSMTLHVWSFLRVCISFGTPRPASLAFSVTRTTSTINLRQLVASPRSNGRVLSVNPPTHTAADNFTYLVRRRELCAKISRLWNAQLCNATSEPRKRAPNLRPPAKLDRGLRRHHPRIHHVCGVSWKECRESLVCVRVLCDVVSSTTLQT